jgi:glyceraldehyde 3-phosphate dehydrogenase
LRKLQEACPLSPKIFKKFSASVKFVKIVDCLVKEWYNDTRIQRVAQNFISEEFSKMANVKVAINGFGRIGRLAFRQMFGAKGYDIVAINDLTSPSMLAHLLKYDSAQGRYELADTVSASDEEGTITVNGKTIKIYKEKDAVNLPWKALDVDVVLECTGFYCSKAKSQAHIDAGAKKVIISAPAGNDLPTVVYSVNEKTLKNTDTIISAASCTTNCLAPMADTLNKYAKIKKGYMTTIHAYTGDQMVLDGPHRKGDLRRARAAAVNIVPNSTGAAKAIGLVVPELNGVLDGCAQRVPVPTGSLTQLIAICEGEVTADGVNKAMKDAASASFGYTEEELVSSDIVGITYGSLFDATQTKCMPMGDGNTLVKVVSWYDNENSYTSQMVRTIKYFAELK